MQLHAGAFQDPRDQFEYDLLKKLNEVITDFRSIVARKGCAYALQYVLGLFTELRRYYTEELQELEDAIRTIVQTTATSKACDMIVDAIQNYMNFVNEPRSGAEACRIELDRVDRKTFFVKSLYATDETTFLIQNVFDQRIDEDILSPLVVASESSTVTLGTLGSQTSDSEIQQASNQGVFRRLKQGSLDVALPRLASTQVYLTHQELRGLWYLYNLGQGISDLKLWYDTAGYANGSYVSFDRGTIREGNIQAFASLCRQGHFVVNLVPMLQSNVGPVTFRSQLDLEDFLSRAIEKVFDMPIGVYAYAFSFPAQPQLHKLVLADSKTGLSFEVINIFDDTRANAPRPTSILSAIERALEKPVKIQYGLWYTIPERPYTSGHQQWILQRCAQMVGAFTYRLIGQNCQSFANWVVGGRFSSIFMCPSGAADFTRLPRIK